jgi:hypothetical protein
MTSIRPAVFVTITLITYSALHRNNFWFFVLFHKRDAPFYWWVNLASLSEETPTPSSSGSVVAGISDRSPQ